jgi:hypothetical protein
MLQEHPQKRPTIYGALREACKMQGKDVPIHDVSDQPSIEADSNINVS